MRLVREKTRACDDCGAVDVSLIVVGGRYAPKQFRLCGACVDRMQRLRLQLFSNNLEAVETY